MVAVNLSLLSVAVQASALSSTLPTSLSAFSNSPPVCVILCGEVSTLEEQISATFSSKQLGGNSFHSVLSKTLIWTFGSSSAPERPLRYLVSCSYLLLTRCTRSILGCSCGLFLEVSDNDLVSVFRSRSVDRLHTNRDREAREGLTGGPRLITAVPYARSGRLQNNRGRKTVDLRPTSRLAN